MSKHGAFYCNQQEISHLPLLLLAVHIIIDARAMVRRVPHESSALLLHLRHEVAQRHFMHALAPLLNM